MSENLNPNISVAEAAQRFLLSLSPEQRKDHWQEVNRFIEWYRGDRPIGGLSASEVGDYAEWVELSTNEITQKLTRVRTFLIYAKKERLVRTGLSSHLGLRKVTSRSKLPLHGKRRGKQVILTEQAYEQLEAQISALEKGRPRIAEEIRHAAADKDFRENAPLEAAREEHERLEAQIKNLKTMLGLAMVMEEDGNEEKADVLRVKPSSVVVVRETSSEEDLTYTIVSPHEIDMAKGKISVVSPMGKALLNRTVGDFIEVATPLGKLCYRIERVEQAGN